MSREKGRSLAQPSDLPKTIIEIHEGFKPLMMPWVKYIHPYKLQVSYAFRLMKRRATSSQPNRVNWSMNHFLSLLIDEKW